MHLRQSYFISSLNDVAVEITKWREKKGFQTSWENCPEKLMLIVTELSEAMEAYRHLSPATINLLSAAAKDNQHSLEEHFPTKIPETIEDSQKQFVNNFVEELADTLVRLLDLTGALGVDLALALDEKMDKNEKRPHKHGKEC